MEFSLLLKSTSQITAEGLLNGTTQSEVVPTIAADPFFATQVIAQLRREYGLKRPLAIQIATEICETALLKARPRDLKFLNAQFVALALDRSDFENVREYLLRNISTNFRLTLLMVSRRFCRLTNRPRRAEFFDHLIVDRNANAELEFSPEIVREIRTALSRHAPDENVLNFHGAAAPKFPPLISAPLLVQGLETGVLRQILSSNYNNRVINYLKNCLGSYKAAILDGRATVLALELDGKPTEAIQINRATMTVAQWAGVGNAPPNAATKNAIVETLRTIGVRA